MASFYIMLSISLLCFSLAFLSLSLPFFYNLSSFLLFCYIRSTSLSLSLLLSPDACISVHCSQELVRRCCAATGLPAKMHVSSVNCSTLTRRFDFLSLSLSPFLSISSPLSSFSLFSLSPLSLLSLSSLSLSSLPSLSPFSPLSPLFLSLSLPFCSLFSLSMLENQQLTVENRICSCACIYGFSVHMRTSPSVFLIEMTISSLRKPVCFKVGDPFYGWAYGAYRARYIHRYAKHGNTNFSIQFPCEGLLHSSIIITTLKHRRQADTAIPLFLTICETELHRW